MKLAVARHGTATLGEAWQALAWLGMAGLGAARHGAGTGPSRFGSVQNLQAHSSCGHVSRIATELVS